MAVLAYTVSSQTQVNIKNAKRTFDVATSLIKKMSKICVKLCTCQMGPDGCHYSRYSKQDSCG